MNRLQALTDEMAAIVEDTRRFLVEVRDGWRGGGAGVVVSPDGLILTNAHVARRSTMSVTLPDGRPLEAALVGRDKGNDLALLQVDAQGLDAIKLGDSDGLQTGEWITAMGHPFGVRGAVTSGVAVGGRQSPEMQGDSRDENRGEYREMVAVSLHLRPGHSGGPMVDSAGRLVGINTMMAGPDVGLGVPIKAALTLIARVREAQAERPDDEFRII